MVAVDEGVEVLSVGLVASVVTVVAGEPELAADVDLGGTAVVVGATGVGSGPDASSPNGLADEVVARGTPAAGGSGFCGGTFSSVMASREMAAKAGADADAPKSGVL